MKTRIKLIILIGIISIFSIFYSGCNYVAPDMNYDNYVVSYIKVIPTTATMSINASKLFEVKAYDSENNLIPIDPSKVEWEASFQCWVCGKVWELNPESGSTTTYFTPEKEGKYYIFAHYKENTDYSPIDAIQ